MSLKLDIDQKQRAIKGLDDTLFELEKVNFSTKILPLKGF